MAINQERIGDVSRDDRGFINVHVVDVVYEEDTSSLGCVSWFNNPHVLLAVVLLQFLIMSIEVSKFVRQNVGIRNKVEILFSILLLHPDDIAAKSILPGNLMTLGKVVDFLILVQPLIQVRLATTG